MHALSHPRTRPAETQKPARSQGFPRKASRHTLTLVLDGLTAEDYLQWVRDPDPPEREDLKLLAVDVALRGGQNQLELLVEGGLQPPRAVAQAVGFPITPEVTALRSDPNDPVVSNLRGVPRRAHIIN